jgi:DNA-binding winged helix-turn-helix (wHTH) protein
MAHVDQQLSAIRLNREPPFRLGRLNVNPAMRQVVSGDRAEILEPRVMQALVAFAQSEGEILSRDELIQLCWGGRIVGDNAIHRVVSKLRGLGAQFGNIFSIETISKVGYRMRVRWDDMPASTNELSLPPGSAPARSRLATLSRRQVFASALAASAAISLGFAYRYAGADRLDPRVADLISRSDQAIRNAVPEAEAQGVGFLEEAVEIQPTSALAWGRLALARSIVAEHAPPDQVSSAVQGTQDAAQRALAIDPRQVDAHSALALLPPYYGDWFSAEQRMNSVLEVDSAHLPTRDARAFLYVAVGRVREGCLDRLHMARREPLHAGHQFKLIYAHWCLGDIGAADRAADRALQLWPKHPAIWFTRLWTLAFTGRAERALAHVEDEAARPDLPPWIIDGLQSSMTALATGRQADRNAAIETVLAQVSKGPSMSINAILILNGLGEIDRALDVAEAYLLERGPLIASVRWRSGQLSLNDQKRRKTNMLFVPVSAGMRGTQRFAELVEEMGLASYWQRIGVNPDFLRR